MVALLKMPSRRWDAEARDARDLDRRMFERRPVEVLVDGRRIDHTLLARRQPTICLSVNDLSLGGLSATTPLPLNPGERLAVSFPQRGLLPAWDAYGRVLRCQPTASGYRVAIEFDPLPAA